MKYFVAIVFFIVSILSHAQDTIIKKNGDIIQAKISEVGIEEVKFKVYGAPDGPTITIPKSDIKKLRVSGQTILDVKGEAGSNSEDVITKKNGDILKVKVSEIGTNEVKFKLFNDPDGPAFSLQKSEIKTMKVEGQTIIDVKTGLTPDLITKKDGTIIKAKIIEMGAESVKYKLYNNPDGPVLSLSKSKESKSEVKSVVIDGQTVYEYKEDPLSISNNSIIDKTSVVKFHFFSPLNHHMAFDYEWMNKPGFNWEVGLGIIGLGIATEERKPSGLFLRGGAKFLLGNSSDIEMDGARLAHPLKGKFVKVEMILNSFSTTNQSLFSNYTNNGNSNQNYVKYQYNAIALDLQYGRQYILGNSITFSWYFGFGYSFEDKTTMPSPGYTASDFDFDLRRYSHTYFGKTFPMIFTSGFTVGYILPNYKAKESKKSFENKQASRHSVPDK